MGRVIVESGDGAEAARAALDGASGGARTAVWVGEVDTAAYREFVAEITARVSTDATSAPDPSQLTAHADPAP